MSFEAGDRVRWETTGDDGLPLVRYGFVGHCRAGSSHVAVMLDGDLTGDTVVELGQLAPVAITTIELHLQGADLIDDPTLRQGLINLWSAEADEAGLEIRSVTCLGTGMRDYTGSYALAELSAGTHQYVLRASPNWASDSILIRAEPATRA